MAAMLMSVGDVAETLRISPHTVRKLATQRRLRRIKLGSRTMFDPRDVEAFVERAKSKQVSEVPQE